MVRFYLATENSGPTLFYVGGARMSPEYPDAAKFPTRGKAYVALVKARERTGRNDLRIVDVLDDQGLPGEGP